MEIPVWAETLFEKVVVVFETPTAGTPLEAAGSTDLLPWIDSLLVEIPLLIENIRGGVFPTSFLTNILGFGSGLVTALPGLLIAFVLVYLLCAGATLALRFRLGQRSLTTITRQICNLLLLCCSFLLIPMLKLLTKDGFGGSFYPILALGAVLLSVCIPLASAIRYLWVYRLRGIPHMVFTVGFGLFVPAALLLSARFGKFLCLLIPLAAAALIAVQWGGTLYDVEEEAWEAPRPKAPAHAPASEAPAVQTEDDPAAHL